ncbi:cell division protein ZipA C-terminal FtsZ-binding domain-containing protein [Legionella micdadei]|uniref:Cell division protein ZipA n=1 Tax=Legionella micdadei TaxID=451 RepID=A0A098GCF9_LEGMI|nr:cell division protein ZipA C-terminal FtsZ-binding domain-containing protein [Legionella micdadei]ARG96465.1 cell division protein ZipA [Legionella micdadei]ARG99215.1 cell division protein ZipA [Legionella micdadei]KTD29443.1 cell division protein ZipA [Legionella micdadei]NSL18159.1 cell division protein ZipA [Legionella micdadei]CEG59675.1 Cell division protein zipA [Legionella micdadei]
MQANWSLILNVLLLIGVVITIARLMKARRRSLTPASQPSLGAVENKHFDDIIAVRKVNCEPQSEVTHHDTMVKITPSKTVETELAEKIDRSVPAEKGKSIMMFLLAKENRQLAGYELLQTVLAAGLRFGEGNLFHRHQHANGQGPVLCSLAAATPSGVFDLQNIGAFSVRGLCLFMHSSGNSAIDAERFTVLYETAKQLRDGLDTHLLDEQKRPLSEASLARYRNQLNIREQELALI